MQKSYKVEIYVKDKKDLCLLLELMEGLFVSRPYLNRVLLPFTEFGRVQVEHRHFDLRKIDPKGK